MDIAQLERLVRRKVELEAELAEVQRQLTAVAGGRSSSPTKGTPPTKARGGRDGLAERIRGAFNDSRPHSSKEVATVLKEPRGRVGDALKRLAQSKFLRRVGPGVYRRR